MALRALDDFLGVVFLVDPFGRPRPRPVEPCDAAGDGGVVVSVGLGEVELGGISDGVWEGEFSVSDIVQIPFSLAQLVYFRRCYVNLHDSGDRLASGGLGRVEVTWRLARSLEELIEEIDAAWPNRSKASDGTIGDLAHQGRVSDHNPNAADVVTAFDGTHDLANGADMGKVSEALRKSKDPRIKYIVFNGRMFSSYAPSWLWRPYTGDPHTSHMHISVEHDYDNTKPWSFGRDWFDMATKADLREVVKEVVEEVMSDQRRLIAVGRSQKGYDADKVNLREILDASGRKEHA